MAKTNGLVLEDWIKDYPALNNEVFREIWSDWEQHREEIRRKLTPKAVKLQLQFLAENPQEAVDIIKQSIRNSWQGLFPLKANYKKKTKLFPIKDRFCFCGMPAVWRSSGNYPSWFCGKHIPEAQRKRLKEEYEL